MMDQRLHFALLVAGLSCSAGGGGSSSALGPEGASSQPGVVFDDSFLSPPPELGGNCVGERYGAEQLPLDMYFLIDLSGSMAESAGTGSKWDLVSKALSDFLSGPQVAGLGLGLGYFPLKASGSCSAGQSGCLCIPFINICLPTIGGSCDAQDYSAPAVPFSPLPDPARLVADLQSRALSGGTPTRPALQGALSYASSWAEQHPERRVAVVLATDGDPAGCDQNNPDDVAQAAAQAWTGPHQIPTFVIGVGRALNSLHGIAEAGGTARAFLTDTQANFQTDFANALGAIRSRAGTCAYEIPPAAAGTALDPNLVNVRLLSAGQLPQLLPMTSDGSAARCDGQAGWYYDNPRAPRSVRLCDASCAALTNVSVDIEYGCHTLVAQPR